MLSTLLLILLILLILFLIGGIPTWPHSRAWGYGPASLLGTILLIYLIMILVGVVAVPFYHYGPP